MSNRGFLIFCCVVGGLAWLAQEPFKNRPQAPEPAAVSELKSSAPTQPIAVTPPPAALAKPSQKAAPQDSIQPLVAQQARDRPDTQTQRQIVYVGVNQLNVRQNPGPSERVVSKLKLGTPVFVLHIRGGWTQILSTDKKTTGWVSSNLLALSKPIPVQKLKQPEAPKVSSKPKFSRDKVVQQIIAESIASYSGRCPCPYHTDRAGRSCGRRSAYSRAGGASVVCFPEDVSDAMVQQFIASRQ